MHTVEYASSLFAITDSDSATDGLDDIMVSFTGESV